MFIKLKFYINNFTSNSIRVLIYVSVELLTEAFLCLIREKIKEVLEIEGIIIAIISIIFVITIVVTAFMHSVQELVIEKNSRGRNRWSRRTSKEDFKRC